MKNKKAFFLIIAVALLVIAIPCVLVYKNYKTEENFTKDTSSKIDSSQSNIENTNKNNEIQVPGYKSITIDGKKLETEITLENPLENPCDFVVSIWVSGKEIYRSTKIHPGGKEQGIKLKSVPERGEYIAIFRYETYQLETGIQLNLAEMETSFIVR